LLKHAIKDPKQAINPKKYPEERKADATVLEGGMLYYETPPATKASWRALLVPAFGTNLPDFWSQHASAVLFFPTKGRWFAMTFGYGRSLLRESVLEPDFGLRTGVNLCEPDTLRAVDYRTIEERTRIGRIQVSNEASVGAFRMDTSTDLLRGLEATSKDKTVCERLGARWSNLAIAARMNLSDLPALGAKLLKYYKVKSLPKEFGWIDNVLRVSDPAEAEALDQELESRLDGGQHAGIRLAFPEIVADLVGLEARFFRRDGAAFCSKIADYLAARPKAVTSTVATARHSHDVVLVDPGTNTVKHRASIYRCLVAELEHTGKLYMLADGEWYQLDRDYVKEVDAVIRRIPVLKTKLPSWNSGEDEGEYLDRAVPLWTGCCKIHTGKIFHGGGSGQIEVGDILTDQNLIGHVKRLDKNSSGLSHLFAQGDTSARLMRMDREFRKKVAAKVPGTHKKQADAIRASKFDHEQWTIAYLILGASSTQPALDVPFFSKVNLRKHYEGLLLMGYRVVVVGC
jgi:uncharacterized protein (TIGR04141 family)